MEPGRPIAGLGVLVAGTLIVTSAGSAGGAWYLQRQRTLAAEQRAELLSMDVERLNERIEAIEHGHSSPSPGKETSEAGGGQEGRETLSTAVADGRHIGFIRSVMDGEPSSLELDLAELLTGTEAAVAHAADGLGDLDAEQYYLRNRSEATVSLPLHRDARFIVWSWYADTQPIEARAIDRGPFLDAMPGGASHDESTARLPYWFTIVDGCVVEVEEQFLP